MIIRTLKTFLILLFLQTSLLANTQYFKEGVKLFNENNLIKAKFKFEQDIVFNPKSEKSYLYLAKIYEQEENDELFEQHLDTVILLNPKNEEAIMLLTLLKIKKSDYIESKKLIEIFKQVCFELCQKEAELSAKLKLLEKK